MLFFSFMRHSIFVFEQEINLSPNISVRSLVHTVVLSAVFYLFAFLNFDWRNCKHRLLLAVPTSISSRAFSLSLYFADLTEPVHFHKLRLSRPTTAASPLYTSPGWCYSYLLRSSAIVWLECLYIKLLKCFPFCMYFA